MRFRIDKFVLAIIVTVFFAYIFPQLESKHGRLLDLISSIGVSMIFFFYGLKLNFDKIKNGLKNWKLHLLVQSSTFLLFPLLILAFKPWVNSESSELVWLSFLFLAALPSTVSSSVVMVTLANGNVAAAIFNASISGLIGIVITPLWIGAFIENSASGFNFNEIYWKLFTEILVPIIIGLLLHQYLGKFTIRYANQLSMFDKSIILLIIYKSFASSFLENIFSSVDLKQLMYIVVGVLFLFYFMYFIIGYISKRLRFDLADQITAQFCGTKKSLVHGTVFSKVLFTGAYPLGIILLPLMLFHAIQILIISIYASRLSKK